MLCSTLTKGAMQCRQLNTYIKAMMSLIARQTFSPEKLRDLVSPRSNMTLLKAYNKCEDDLSQTEITNLLDIDPGYFSRVTKQWIDDGIILKVGEGRNTRLVHVYPLPDKFLKESKKKAA